jgi:hypothetical protein
MAFARRAKPKCYRGPRHEANPAVSDRWAHSVCDQCWAEKKPGTIPHRFCLTFVDTFVGREQCCYCGREHESGIRLGEDPERVACGGVSGIHKKEGEI